MTPKDKRYDYDGVYFTMGPLSINQFAEFSKHGLGAIRLFQCIRSNGTNYPDAARTIIRLGIG